RWGPRRSSGCAWPCGATAARWRCRPGPPWRWRASSRRSRSARASRCCCPIRCAPGRPPTSRWRTPRRSTWPSWSATRSVVARLADGGVLLVQAETQRKGEVPAGLVSGRMPLGPTEIALSPRIAAQQGVNVGDTVTVVNRNGRPLPLTVTGTVAVVDDAGHLGTTNVVTDAALGGLARTSPIVRAEIVAAPGQAGPLTAQLGRNLEILPRETPPEVRNLADLAPLPEILAAALAVVAGAAMAHTLIIAARRHTREMAVLAAVGATPRQVRGMLAVLGGAIVAPALVLGVPVGLATARLLWWQVATSIGVGGDLTPPAG